MSLRPKRKKCIAGKTRSEILSMHRNKRTLWYKTISPEEKEEAMKIVKIVKQTKHSEFMMSAGNPMYGKITSEEANIKRSASMTGKKNPMYGKTPSKETRDRRSKALKGRPKSEEHKIKLSEAATEREKDPVRKTKQSADAIERWKDLEFRNKHSGERHPFFGKPRTEDTKRQISASLQGITLEEWSGFAGEQPYCHLWTERLREHIRNLDDRTCTICGKSTLQNISKNGKWLGRLAVDHVDENKMQGCGDWEWRLIPLCHSCHAKMQKQEKHLLLQLLLFNNKKHQTNFLFGDESYNGKQQS